MVAWRQVEIPYYKSFGRQRGRRFGALAQIIEKTEIKFLREYVVPAAKRMSAESMEFAAPEFEEVVSGRKRFKSVPKSVGRQTLKKPFG